MSSPDIKKKESSQRWKPGGRRRLQEAALALFDEQGFAATTTASIAERAGLTERTFFRYFSDKKEVLFGDEAMFATAIEQAILHAPRGAAPYAAARLGLEALSCALQPRFNELRKREQVFSRAPELRERELSKAASFSAAVSAALQKRGVRLHRASIVAETSLGLFRVAYGRWLAREEEGELISFLDWSYQEFRKLIPG